MSQILIHDVRNGLPFPDKIAHTCVTSPPYYGLRDYGVEGQIGLEDTPDAYVARLVDVFREVRRVLRDDGTLWLNLGDSYSGGGRGGNSDGITGRGKNASQLENRSDDSLPAKNLLGIPWRVAFALQADGWYLRQDIIWHKPNPMPESVTDRCTKAHEYIFLLSKSERYYFDQSAMMEPVTEATKKDRVEDEHRPDRGFPGNPSNGGGRLGSADTRNRRSVWTVATQPYSGAHFATFPPNLIRPCILAGAPVGGVVLDPFMGSGTTAAVAMEEGREYIGTEINPGYQPLYAKRLWATHPGLGL